MRDEMTRKRTQSLIQSAQESNFTNFDYFISSDGTSSHSSPWHKSKETLISMEHGTYIAVDSVPEKTSGPGQETEEEDEESMDWWTKYHASLDTLIEIYPIIDVDYDLENLASIVTDVRDLNQLNPTTIARLTSQVSSISASMFDVSNLKKTSSMSVSSPNLAVPGGPVPGLFTKWGRGKKSKLATSKTHLLKSTDGLDNA